MANNFEIKLLAHGQLPVAEADLYLVPAATTAIVKMVALVNTDSVDHTFNILVRKSGSGVSRRVSPVDKTLAAGDLAETPTFGEYTLGAGDAIRGYADAAGFVDFSVHGIQET